MIYYYKLPKLQNNNFNYLNDKIKKNLLNKKRQF